MNSCTQAAMERAMKVQEVMLQALAKKISWWQAAEILGISERHRRRWRERYEEFGFRGLFEPQASKAFAQARGGSDPGAGAGAVAGALFRSECAALSPEAGGRASDSAQLQLGERDSARSGDGGRWAQARNAPQTTTATTLAGDAAAQRRQPAPLVGRGALARSDRDSG